MFKTKTLKSKTKTKTLMSKDKTNTTVQKSLRSRLVAEKKAILVYSPFMLNTSYHTKMIKCRVLNTM